MKNINILFITQEYSAESAGGAGVYAYELTRALAERRITVHVLAPGNKTHDEVINKNLIIHWQGVVNLPLMKMPVFYTKVARKAPKLIKRHNILSVHSNNNAGVFALTKLPTIATIHHLVSEEIAHVSLLQRWVYAPDLIFERVLLRRARIVIAVSHSVRDSLQPVVAPERLVVIPDGIDTTFFKKKSPVKIRRELGIQEDEAILLHPGGARAKRKGGLDLVKALGAIKHLKFRCVISGVSREAGWQNEFYSTIKAAGLWDRFIWVEEVNYKRLPELYSAADIVVYPSTFEGFGLPILEALSCEKPIVCTKTGEAVKIITDGRNGLLIDVHDVNGLRTSIEQLINSKGTRTRLARAGRRVTASYDWRKVAEDVAEVHKQFVDMTP